jgi:fibronectin-binding autotransporter adhesin
LVIVAPIYLIGLKLSVCSLLPRQCGLRLRSLSRHCRVGRATELVLILSTGAALVLAGPLAAQSTGGPDDVVFDSSIPIIFEDDISGPGRVIQNGPGTVTLAGANTYTGGTQINAGVLRLGSERTLGTGAVTIADGAALTLGGSNVLANPMTIAGAGTGTGAIVSIAGNNSVNGSITLAADATIGATAGSILNVFGTIGGAGQTVSFAGTGIILMEGNISTGTGGLINNADVLYLRGTNTFTGDTVINGGFVLIANGNAIADTGAVIVNAGTFYVQTSETVGSISGQGTIALASGATLTTGGTNASTIFGGSIADGGGLTKQGTGTLVLAGDNSYSGTTTINGGTLQIGNGGTSGTLGGGSVVNNGSLVFDRSDIVTIGQVISGTGNVTHAGTGTVILTGQNSYTGTTTINGGTLQIGTGASGGTLGTGNVENAGTLVFNSYDLDTVANVISGTGNVTMAGYGPVTLTGNNTYTGTTTIAQGTLRVGEGGTTGSLGRGAVVNDGWLTFNRSDVVTVDNAISGMGGLLQLGAGRLVLSGDNSYAGITGIGGDLTLQIGDGGTSGTLGSGEVQNWGALVFDRSDSYLVTNTISFGGSLTQAGTGILRLAGNNSYFGATLVQSGVLELQGGAAIGNSSAVTVAEGALLRVLDSERIGSLTNLGAVDLTGTTGPGTVLTVTGDYLAGSDLLINAVLGGDNSASDLLVVEGDTAGTTRVYLTNQGGTGAMTDRGILVVDVQGASTGEFVLANGNIALQGGETGLSAGSHVYLLRDVDGDWYLQSQLHPTTVVLEALPAAILAQILAQSRSQRLAGRQMLVPAEGLAFAQQVPAQLGAWLSVSAGQSEVTPAASTTGLQYEADRWRMQAGVERLLHTDGTGILTGGVSLFAGTGTVDAISELGGGRISSDARGIGLSATWLGDSGFYADLQLEYALLEAEINATGTDGPAMAVEGTGRMASVELGQRLAGAGDLTWTPQAQVSWSDVRMDDFTGPDAVAVTMEDSESLRLRLGLAGEKAWVPSPDHAAQLYGIASVTREFRGATSVLVDTAALNATAPEWIAELGLGGSYDWAAGAGRSAIYGEVTTTRAISGGEVSGLSGAIGVQVSW